MSSVIALNQIDGRELWKKVGFKPSEKVLVALRGVYNLPFNLDDPVLTYFDFGLKRTVLDVKTFILRTFLETLSSNWYNYLKSQVVLEGSIWGRNGTYTMAK